MIDNVVFPTQIAQGAQGGPEYSTTITISHSGYEQRNQNWLDGRAKWNVATGVQNVPDLIELITFFRARKGRARGFLFKDWSDYRASDQALSPIAGSTTQYQLVKNYASGPSTEARKITRPKSGTVVIKVGGVVQSSGWTVSDTTGVVTFDFAPAGAVTASFDFYVPVRFDADHMATQIEGFGTGGWENIPVVEVRE